jgi:membrane associated rhomboid family serine protease
MIQGRGFGSIPPVVKNLIIINVLVQLAQFVFAKQEIYLEVWGALWGFGTGNFKIWQLVTYMFMHSTSMLFHIIFNMLTLWMFGSILENLWGSKRFIQFYFICGVASGIVQMLIEPNGIAVGASGAIMGLMAAFAYLFPNNVLYMMFIPIPIKAKIAIPLLMAMDLFGGVYKTQGDNVAHWAHLGGAAAGFILVLIWNKTNRRNFY